MSPSPSPERRAGAFGAARAGADAVLAAMTLPEKAGQVTQVEKDSITPDEVAAYAVGSVLSGCGGNPEPNDAPHRRRMVDAYLDGAERSRLGIPLLYGTDSVHGHGNVVGATICPHNIGLGAAADTDLVERVYRATAIETAATGARLAFAPTVSVALDPRWGRTYESFGDDPELVGTLGAAAVRGLRGSSPGSSLRAGDTTLACLKHYVGDGGTQWGSVDDTRVPWIDWWDAWGDGWRIDQGDTRIDEAALRRIHLAPYRAGIEAGALSVMASYSSWSGDKLHGHRRLLTDVLKGELDFAGFVVSDWLGIAQPDPDPYRCAVLAIGAGIDLVMLPFEFRPFIADVVKAVEIGDLDPARLDEAVRGILTVKHLMGVFDHDGDESAPPPETGVGIEVVGSAKHRTLAREAVAASAPHAEGQDDRSDRTLPAEDTELVRRLQPRVERLVLVAVSGRPLLLDEVIDHCDAIVAAWLPGTEGAGVADVLTRTRPFRGRLPRPWPGRGITADQPTEATR